VPVELTAFGWFLAFALGASSALAAPTQGAPSHPPFKNCAWEQLADAAVGLAAWVMRCDYGFRKIDFTFVGHALAIRFSDGGAPDPLVEVIDMLSAETPEAAVKRHFNAHTEAALAARCVMATDRSTKPRTGVKRYTFVPNAGYAKELKAKEYPGEVGDPPCGDWGTAPDGIQYYEVHPASKARKVLFVRVGQDEPLFDEKTLRLIAQ
ncbi:MAG TPA: hypothetical protein VFJ48_05485, partial [Casimicrobiaceae bacterium]|nr:hypothetical protein [Casimicrobiaceae bacterium]